MTLTPITPPSSSVTLTDVQHQKPTFVPNMNPRGMLSYEQFEQEVGNGNITTIIIGITDCYGRLCGKRLDAEYFLCHPKTFACDYLFACDIDMNPIKGFNTFNWEKGYGDFAMIPDLSTLRICSWHPKTAMVLANAIVETTEKLVSVAPRTLLLDQVKRMEELNFDCKAASELEYYCFKEGFAEANRTQYMNLTPVSNFVQDYSLLQASREEDIHGSFRHHLKASGIPVETSKGEAGKGQHELNVHFTKALEVADRTVVYKQCLKEVADQKDISVSFMAKPTSDQSGSSCHIHMSLWNKDGSSAFYDENAEPWFGLKCTKEFRYFLGGWIKHTPELMPFYAPTINSYKRYTEGSWAPTRLAWSLDNRTAGFRIVGNGKALRIEFRIPGADCNCYMAFAAAIASGIDGIKNKIEPPPLFEGDVYAAQEIPRVAYSLKDAIELMKKSKFARDNFGDEVIDHYYHFFGNEVQDYERAVTDWERTRYFERI